MKKLFALLVSLFCIAANAQNLWMEFTSDSPELNRLCSDALDVMEYEKNQAKALELLKEAEIFSAEKPEYKAQVKSTYATIFRMSDGNSTAAKVYESALKDLDGKFPELEAFVYYGIYRNFIGQADFKNGLQQLYKALKIYENRRNNYGISRIKTEIGGVFGYMEDHAMAEKYLKEAKDLALKIDERELLFLNTLYYTNYYLAKGDLNTALASAQEHLDEIKARKQEKILGYTFENISTIYHQKKDFTKAIAYLDSAVAYTKKEEEKNFYTTNKALIYADVGNTGEAEKILLNFLETNKNSPRLDYILQVRKALAELYQKTGDSVKAAQQIVLSHQISEKLNTEKKNNQLREEEYQYLLKNQEQAFRQKSFWVKSLLYFAGLVVVALLVIFYLNLKKHRAVQKAEAYKLKTLEFERQSAQQKQQELDHEKKSLERELAANTLFITENNKVLKDISVNLKEIKENEGFTSPKISELEKKIKSAFRNENDWEKLKVHFEKVNPDFFSKLKKINPKITTTEMKHCAYIKIGLNNKETAQILGIEPHSVKTTRYRLKKKLDLTPEDDLSAFIANI